MERNETQGSDHAVYIVVSVVVLGLLAFFASQSVIVVHKIELPILRIEAGIFSYCFSNRDYEVELYKIEKIKNALDAEFAKKNDYSTIKTGVLKKVVKTSSIHTRNCTRILACIFLGCLGSLVIFKIMTVRSRLYERRENICFSQQKGIEEFVHLVGRYLDPDVAKTVKKSPTPQNVADAFAAAREKVNIPCSVAARLFPRKSRERIALLEYGKAKVKFADNTETR